MTFDWKRIGAAFSKKENWKTLGWTVAGGITGEVLGATIQGFGGKNADGSYKMDMSGIKGDLITGGITSAIYFGFDIPAGAVGTLAVKGMKQFYLHGNPQLAKLVGSPIPPVKKDDQHFIEPPAAAVSDEPFALDTMTAVPAGMRQITRPDGQPILVSAGTTGETVNDYSNVPLADYSNTPLNDYSNVPLADYSQSPFGRRSSSLSDDSAAMLEMMANGY